MVTVKSFSLKPLLVLLHVVNGISLRSTEYCSTAAQQSLSHLCEPYSFRVLQQDDTYDASSIASSTSSVTTEHSGGEQNFVGGNVLS